MAALCIMILCILSSFRSSISASENEALLKLKSSLNNTSALSGWVPGSPPCANKWVGVICEDRIISGIHLSDFGLSGTIDVSALQELPGLRTISFVNNSFSGNIPLFNKLGALKSLLLSENNFSGEIPADYFSSMSSLKKVWLSKNNFSGEIPSSLMALDHLIELHLEGNRFSGSIPPLQHPEQVTSLDLSRNNLEGPIPESYSKFGKSSFVGNGNLCGNPLDKTCEERREKTPESSSNKDHTSSDSGILFGFVVVVVIGCFAVATMYFSRRKSEDDDNFSELNNESVRQLEDPIHRSESNSSARSSRKGGGSSMRRGYHSSKNGSSDLVMVNHEKGSFGMADLMKAAAEVLGNGGLGSSYKAMMNSGLSVVVKRMREMNAYEKDEFEVEMRRFGRIKHRNILTPLAYHYRKEEKLMVSEYLPKGSLLYILHGDRGICHAELTWPTRLKIIHGIGRALGYLHSEYANYTLPHGNLKSSNVLLSSSYDPLLSDYALHPMTNPGFAAQAMFAYKSPEYAQTQQVSPKSDVYCLGIIILEVVTGKFPSQYLANGKGGTDVVQWVHQARSSGREEELIDPEIATSTNSINQMVQLLRIGAACAESNPTQRLDMREAIRRIEGIQE